MIHSLFFALALLGLVGLQPGSTAAPLSRLRPGLATPEPDTLRWRVGVGVSHSHPVHFAWPSHRPGWFHNWDIDIFTPAGGYNRPLPHLDLTGDARALGMDFVPMISTRGGTLASTTAVLTALAGRYKGRAWIVGNEPDNAAQDAVTADQYATAYHAAYQAIKGTDPSAVIVAGNLSQVTPLRLQYLDAILTAYRERYGTAMPVDVWGSHLYVLPEQANSWGAGLPPGIEDGAGEGERWTVEQHDDLALVATQVRTLRSWMAANGYADRPLWITEYGILMPPAYGFRPERVASFMRGSFDLFRSACDEEIGLASDGGRLVQRWNWFSTRAPQFPAGNLFDEAGQPTLLMHVLADYLAEHAGDQQGWTCN